MKNLVMNLCFCLAFYLLFAFTMVANGLMVSLGTPLTFVVFFLSIITAYKLMSNSKRWAYANIPANKEK